VAWHCDWEHIATGNMDTIRVWNIETGHPTARMTMGRAETYIWSLAITRDMTVISGDSRGQTSLWNGKNGTLMDSVHSHKADVLPLALSGNETTAYSRGVDPTLVHFQVGHL
jgi:U3 small nucleolar RNA-associated protein 4